MDNEIRIDGAMGEGGGQVLRTSLTLSALTGRPLVIEGIRAGRRKPGLLRQHLTGAKAVAEICGGELEGAHLSSERLRLVPGEVKGGKYRFAVGSAGSACLVAQTVLPLLWTAEHPSEVRFEGGTHNPWAPTYDFLEEVFFPALREMGVEIESKLIVHGFYPAGGGAFEVKITPTKALTPAIERMEAGELRQVRAKAIFSKIPYRVAERELSRLREGLSELGIEGTLIPHEVKSPGSGNVVSILVERNKKELLTAFGARGVRAEKVAELALEEAARLIESDVPVGKHLADQLLLPLAMAGGGRYRTLPLSEHSRTQMQVIERFLPTRFDISESGKDEVVVEVR